MTVLEIRDTAHGGRDGYKVDVYRGDRIGRVSSEWLLRPADERYLSLSGLYGAARDRTERSQTRTVESFNGRMRDEFLNETLFFGLDDARRKLASWVADYNGERPHSSLKYAPPGGLRGHPHRNGRSATQPRPAPPIARCSSRRTTQ